MIWPAKFTTCMCGCGEYQPWVWFSVSVGEVGEEVRVDRVNIIIGECTVSLHMRAKLQCTRERERESEQALVMTFDVETIVSSKIFLGSCIHLECYPSLSGIFTCITLGLWQTATVITIVTQWRSVWDSKARQVVLLRGFKGKGVQCTHM